MHRGVRHAVQVTAFILLVQMDRRRDHPLVQYKQAGQRLNGARSAQHVPGHGLRGADVGLLRLRLAQRLLDRRRLDEVVHRCPRAVRIDVNGIYFTVACLFHGVHHRLRAAAGVGMGRRDMIRVAGGAVAADLAVNPCAARLCVLIFLEDQRRSALPDHKAAPAPVEGQGCRIRIIGCGQRLHIDKAGNGGGDDRRFRTAGDDRVGIAVANQTHGLADGIGAGGAGRDRRHGKAPAVMADRDHTGGHIADHHGHKQRGYPAGPPLEQLGVFRFKGADAADAGPENDRKALRQNRALHAALIHRLLGGGHGKLGVAVGAQHVVDFHICLRIEVPDLGAQLCFEFFGIEAGDGPNAVFAVFQAFPHLGGAVAQRRDRADACDDDSSVFTHNCSPHMAMPPSTRSTSPVT